PPAILPPRITFGLLPSPSAIAPQTLFPSDASQLLSHSSTRWTWTTCATVVRKEWSANDNRLVRDLVHLQPHRWRRAPRARSSQRVDRNPDPRRGGLRQTASLRPPPP